MKVHCHVDLQEICPIGWAITQEVITPGREESPGIHSHEANYKRSITMTNMRKPISSNLQMKSLASCLPREHPWQLSKMELTCR